MMRRIILIVISIVSLSLASCVAPDPFTEDPEPIVVAASTSSLPDTRSSYSNSEPSSSNPFEAEVWLSTTAHSYPGAQNQVPDENATVIDFHTKATFTSSSKQLLADEIYYPHDGTNVYLVGLYPRGWSAVDSGSKASYLFDGSNDLMTANEVSNSIYTSANYPILEFNHLLTWIKVSIAAENQLTADAWGHITDMSIKSKNSVEVNLSDNTVSFNQSGAVANINMHLNSDDSVVSNADVAIPTESKQVAYVLCEPVVAGSQDYDMEVTISTSNRNNIKIPVILYTKTGSRFSGNTAGHQFNLSLRFIQGDNILVKATVTEWVNEGASVVPVEED